MRLAALVTTLLLAWPLAGRAQEPSPERGRSTVPGGEASAAAAMAPARAETMVAVMVAAMAETMVAVPTAMVAVPAGSYVPAFAPVGADGTVPPVRIEAFELDRTPVTVAEYLSFVRSEPAWRRGRAPEVLVGEGYLAAWRSDLDPGLPGEELGRPATGVSWFAARAYCAARGARLPTTDEWEYAAALGGLLEDGSRDPDFTRRLRALYAARPGPDALPPVGRTFRNGPGLWDLHGLVQEWTADFNGLMATGSGRDDQGLDRGLFCAAGSADATDRSDYAAFTRYSFRTGLTGDYAGRMLGFRCARTP